MKFRMSVHWDVDGTLADTEPLHMEKLIVVSKRYGVKLREEDFSVRHSFPIPAENGGMKDATMILHGAGDKMLYYWVLARKAGLEARYPLQRWLDDLTDYYIDNKHQIKPRDNAPDLIAELHYEKDAIQGIVTSGLPKQVDANLHVLGKARSLLSYIITAGDVVMPKPYPEGYLLAQQKAMSIVHSRYPDVVVLGSGVEDSPVGVQAVMSADLACVHFVLPGQQPVVPTAGGAEHFRVATTVKELKDRLVEMHQIRAVGCGGRTLRDTRNQPAS